MPIFNATASVADVIITMSKSGFGLAIVMESDVVHVITDGDLRRVIEHYQEKLFSKCAADLMVADPVTMKIGTRVEAAIQLMEAKGINSVLVTGVKTL